MSFMHGVQDGAKFIGIFILIGAAASIGGEHCLKTHLSVAKELGANEEQLLSATLLGSFIAETKTLTKSLRVFYDIKE